MELRGTRPIRDDPDVLARLFTGGYYGWPDFSADLQPVTAERFQPPLDLVDTTGYPDVSFLVDHSESGLVVPDERFAKNAIMGIMPSQSGASGVEFAPADGPFRSFAGSAIVALAGDRAPFATSGQKTKGSIGFKLVRVDVDRGQVRDFVRNVQDGPSSRLGGSIEQLERPVDLKFGPDGALYILDFGEMEVRDGEVKAKSGSGRIYRMIPAKPAVPVTP
jgi:glucose/arabinose dehydrogenase